VSVRTRATRRRSWLFVPGDKPQFIEKLAGLPLDAAILDLEDGVAPDAKPRARQAIARAIERDDLACGRFVRVNRVSLPEFALDMGQILVPGLHGIVLPKVESSDEIRETDRLLADWEQGTGLEVGSTGVLVSIESALGLVRAPDLAAASPRVLGLILGSEDLALDLGLPARREAEAKELIYVRSALVIAARSAGVLAVDGVHPELDDLDGLRRDGMQARRLGFDGKLLFHPEQIDVVNQLFSPTEDELIHAREIVAAFDAAVARGDGVVAVRGRLIDLPIVLRARRTLDAASASG
jgi:citrate lyase subunit beta/citryl-CoA lyase